MSENLEDILNVDINDLTIAEMVEIEERTGLSIDSLGETGIPKGKVLQAMAYIIKRRANPEFTWEEAGALKINTTAEKVNPTEDEG
tara:strand:+ start:340 stop:597 length:258 start_codon:yes stop_codon:yes gene_type:complete